MFAVSHSYLLQTSIWAASLQIFYAFSKYIFDAVCKSPNYMAFSYAFKWEHWQRTMPILWNVPNLQGISVYVWHILFISCIQSNELGNLMESVKWEELPLRQKHQMIDLATNLRDISEYLHDWKITAGGHQFAISCTVALL